MSSFIVHETNIFVRIMNGTSLANIWRQSSWRCSLWHHRRSWNRSKARRRGRWISLCRVEHGHPTRWRRRRLHARRHTHPWHPWHRALGLHRCLHLHRRESGWWGRCCGQCTSELTLIWASEAARHGWRSAVCSRGWALGKWECIVLPGLGS
jgi:hypothetical protein